MTRPDPETSLPPDFLEDYLGPLEQNFDRFIWKRLAIWAVRWAIGFGLIWAVTSWTGRFHWLWWVGLTVAALSLAILVGMRILIKRRITGTRRARDRMREELRTATERDADTDA